MNENSIWLSWVSAFLNLMKYFYVGSSPSKYSVIVVCKISLNSCLKGLDQLFINYRSCQQKFQGKGFEKYIFDDFTSVSHVALGKRFRPASRWFRVRFWSEPFSLRFFSYLFFFFSFSFLFGYCSFFVSLYGLKFLDL